MILVTGATGFLGSELVKQLMERGENVRATKRSSSKIPAILAAETTIEWVEADILDYFALEEAFEGVTDVYHCAAHISFDPGKKKLLRKINAEGTGNIVNLSLEKGIRKLVHVSSIAAIGEAKPGELITEDLQWEFSDIQNGYAISKYESEMEVWRGIAEGLKAVIVNPSLIIGKNAGTDGTGQIFETIRKGLKFYTQGTCGYIDVEDVAKSMIKLMKSDIHSERFIINAENRSFHDIFTLAAGNFGNPPPTIAVRPWMLSLAWRLSGIAAVFTGKQIITRYTAHGASAVQEYSNKKIKKAVGIEFKPIDKSIAEICSTLNQA